jgi:hypothetical protein
MEPYRRRLFTGVFTGNMVSSPEEESTEPGTQHHMVSSPEEESTEPGTHAQDEKSCDGDSEDTEDKEVMDSPSSTNVSTPNDRSSIVSTPNTRMSTDSDMVSTSGHIGEAPENLHAWFQRMDQEVAAFYEDHPEFKQSRLEAEVAKLEAALKNSSRGNRKRRTEKLEEALNDKKWMLANRHSVAIAEVMVRNPLGIHSMKRVDGITWEARVWTSRTTLSTVELRDKAVKNLLQAFSYNNRFQGEFEKMRKYDFLAVLDATNFRSIQACSYDDFGRTVYRMYDCHGGTAIVDADWAELGLTTEVIKAMEDEYVAEQGGNKPWQFPFGSRANTSSAAPPVLAAPPPVVVLGPPIKYRNNVKVPACLTRSVASALDYLGFVKEAKALGSVVMTAERGCQVIKFGNTLRTTLKENCGTRISYIGAYCSGKRYDPLDPHHRDTRMPIAACLKAERVTQSGKREPVNLNHCVCFVGDYVFDSNLERALPISLESLNTICSSIVGEASYCGLYWSRLLTPQGGSNY